jgi:hypothetical protein
MGKYKHPYLEKPHIWHEEFTVDGELFMWVYPDYKCRRLTIRKIEEGKYLPLGNGSNDFRNVPQGEKFYCKTLEEAKTFLFNYIDDIIKNDERSNKDHLKDFLKSYVERRTKDK